MNGADILIQTAIECGVEVCFSNPGTTELPLVNAMDSISGMRAVLGLFEGVCTGAADGYGRMKDKPAMTLLHLGPGLANGIANLHNAKRAKTPIFNVIGEHATWHRPHDPLLAMDIEALASTVSGWKRTAISADRLSQDTAEAIVAANQGCIATLIVPNDCQWSNSQPIDIDISKPVSSPEDDALIETAAKKLLHHKKSALVLGKGALCKQGLAFAADIREATGCDLLCETFPVRMERGAGFPDVLKIPYLPEMAIEMLKPYEFFIFAGAREPVAFFGYNGMPSKFLSGSQERIHIGNMGQNIIKALKHLLALIPGNHTRQAGNAVLPHRPAISSGSLTSIKACETLAALQPENAIVVDEGITNSLFYYPLTAGCPPFTLLALTGGAIGQGPPCAIGAAIACPDRPVINFQADGSAMYTVQSLWTQARENLNITTLICSNHGYDILKLEIARSGIVNPGKNAMKMTDLSGINWAKIAESQGVPGVLVNTAEALAKELEKALAEDGPHLIEMQL
jgi:acetolactate synthase I/II/III large subunit